MQIEKIQLSDSRKPAFRWIHDVNCENEPDGDAIDLLTRTSTRTSLKRARGQSDTAPSVPAKRRPSNHSPSARAPSESPCKSEDAGGDSSLDLLSYMASAARHGDSECTAEINAEREMSDASTEPTPSSPVAATNPHGATLADVEALEKADQEKCQDFAAGMQAMVEFAASNPVEFCAWLAQFRALVQRGASVDMVRAGAPQLLQLRT
jgi:hypothetical protein